MGRLVLLTVAVLAVSSSPALAAGTLRVSIAGPGTVTGSGISCSRTLLTLTTGTCSQSYVNVRECDDGGLKPICVLVPPEVAVTAATSAPGFVFDHWSGDCTGSDATCALTMSDSFGVTATFRDNQDPAVALTAPGTARGVVGLSASATDNAAVARVEFTLGGVTISDGAAPYTASFDTTALKDGATTATATAVDSSGRAKSASTTVLIDNNAPSLTVGGTADGTVAAPGASESWTLAAVDKLTGVAQVRCSVVPAGTAPSFGACSGGLTGHTVSGKPEGSYVFTARAVDGAGNTTDVARTFAVDGTPPVTSIVAGVADGATTSDTSLSWSFTASEAASFACRVYPAALTPGDFGACSGDGSHTAAGFAPGVYTFEVRATDLVGNVEAAPVKRTFTVVAHPAAAPVAGGGSSSLLAASKSGALPQILVTLAFNFSNSTKKQTKLTSLAVKNVPSGATVRATCPKSCAKKSFVKAPASGTVSLRALIKKPLKAGTLITVAVSKPGFASVTKILKIQARKSPTVTTRTH